MSNKTVITVFCLLVTAAFMAGCYYDNEEDLYQFYYANNICDTANVSFSEDIFPIFQSNCNVAGCHVAGGTGNGLFENYNQIKAKVDNGSLMNRVVNLRNMPPAAPLADCPTLLIETWLNNGALNN